MNNIVIRPLDRNEQIPWKLLLLADPSKEIIEAYLPLSKIYIALLDNEVIGAYVLTMLSSDITELKNIAVDEKHQGKGFGKFLVLDAIRTVKNSGLKRIEVGTGNSSLTQLALYQKCGFRIISIDKDFFIKNYKEEIFENGIQCTDMIRLAIDFT